jgi:hypothetical protein
MSRIAANLNLYQGIPAALPMHYILQPNFYIIQRPQYLTLIGQNIVLSAFYGKIDRIISLSVEIKNVHGGLGDSSVYTQQEVVDKTRWSTQTSPDIGW